LKRPKQLIYEKQSTTMLATPKKHVAEQESYLLAAHIQKEL
jgi:hypothetical protein